MRRRSNRQLLPSVDRLESKQLMSAGASPADTASAKDASAQATADASHAPPATHFLAYRITNPSPFNGYLIPPFTQVMVQSRQPVPGQVYNILFITVRNGTAQTFGASSNFLVRLPGGKSFPILTGSQQWQPGQIFVFYVLTKKYYPLAQVPGGYQLDLGGSSSTLVPGPSGIFLRIKYNPATFAHGSIKSSPLVRGAQEVKA